MIFLIIISSVIVILIIAGLMFYKKINLSCPISFLKKINLISSKENVSKNASENPSQTLKPSPPSLAPQNTNSVQPLKISHEEKQEEIKVSSKNLSDVLNLIDDSDVKESVDFLKKNTPIKFNENAQITSRKDAKDFVSQEIIDFLKNKNESIKQRVSQLRKIGVEMDMEAILLMSLPLKIKIFSATHKKSDLENLMGLINRLETEVTKIEKEKEEAEKEKESKAALIEKEKEEAPEKKESKAV